MKTILFAFLLAVFSSLPQGGVSASFAAEPAEASADAAEEKPPEQTEEEKAEEEFQRQRETERLRQMLEARKFILVADETVARFPYPLNFLLGVSIEGIALWRYLAALVLIFLHLLLLLYVSRKFRRAKRETDGAAPVAPAREAVNVLVMALPHSLKIIIVGLLLRGVSSFLVTRYHPDVVWLSNILVYLGLALYFYVLAGIVDEVYGERIYKSDNHLLETIRPLILKFVRVVIILVAGMHIYQSVTGQTMVSLLAGLGIGGLALALASQTTLQNLLGFASIALDKAFFVGDTVNIGDNEGTVEHIGIRSLVIRTYDGRAVVVPNNTAINSNIVNLNRRPYLRREIRIALSPANSYEKMKEALDAIGAVLSEHEGKIPGLPPVVRFADYEPARFVVQALFWYDSSKPLFSDECSRINLEICKRLSEAGVRYAER